jgi:hypothetical protein
MIIEIQGIPFHVEHACEDGDIYLSSVKLQGYELVNILSPEWLDVILDKVIKHIEEENKEAWWNHE